MPEIFLSYNREDASVAKLFADGFAREGLEVWWDQVLHSGDSYDAVTEEALHSAGAVVVLWSPRSVASRWVRAEATVADQNKTFMPVTIAACRRPVMFELTQTADLSHWRGKADDPAWRAFVADVRRMLGRKAESHAPAVAAHGGAAIAEAKSKWSRRNAVLGVAGAGTAAALAYAGWTWLGRHEPDPRAVELYKRAQQIEKNGVVEAFGEARAAYKQSVAIDPDYAEAWGALALSFVNPSFGGGLSAPGGPQQVRAAAQRAQALDPGNADAGLALIGLDPFYRHWQESEARLRAFLRDHPDSAAGHAWLGWLLLNVGRIDDASTEAGLAIAIDPAPKIFWILRAFAHYMAGRDGPGDVAMEELRLRWPQDPEIYAVGYYWLLVARRYAEARAYAADASRRPRVIRPEMSEAWMRKADALATGHGVAEFQNALSNRGTMRQGIEMAVIDMASFGKVDELFSKVEIYFFGGEFDGRPVPPPEPFSPRNTFELFFPVLSGLRDDPRFASLLERAGLEDYWRKSGTQPDFRRGR